MDMIVHRFRGGESFKAIANDLGITEMEACKAYHKERVRPEPSRIRPNPNRRWHLLTHEEKVLLIDLYCDFGAEEVIEMTGWIDKATCIVRISQMRKETGHTRMHDGVGGGREAEWTEEKTKEFFDDWSNQEIHWRVFCRKYNFNGSDSLKAMRTYLGRRFPHLKKHRNRGYE